MTASPSPRRARLAFADWPLDRPLCVQTRPRLVRRPWGWPPRTQRRPPLPTGRTTLSRRWINVYDFDSTSRQRRAPGGLCEVTVCKQVHPVANNVHYAGGRGTRGGGEGNEEAEGDESVNPSCHRHRSVTDTGDVQCHCHLSYTTRRTRSAIIWLIAIVFVQI